MQPTTRSLCLGPLILILALALSSCGGGSGTTAGVGGSGVGGTGITTVTGNVSQVVAAGPANQTLTRKLLAGTVDWLATPVNAQSGSLAGIQVIGGGRVTTTNDSGEFILEDVTPSDNFVLRFVLPDEDPILLPIGSVPDGARIRVINILVDTGQGFATAGGIEIQDSGGSADDDSDDLSDDDGDDNSDDESDDNSDQDSNG
ncbi:MAG: hypothetical protein U5R46_03835 [Gammaproteobacteria bacterium]|nr:hypothetical protein [Gammaproteobacteria bacterium]